MGVTQWFQCQAADFYDKTIRNFSIPEMNMLKNSSTLAVFVPINLPIKAMHL